MDDSDHTASLMTPAKLAQFQLKPRAPVSPSAWLDKMASDAGHQHLRRIAELSDNQRAQAAGRDYQPLAAELAAMAQALSKLDFGLLQARGLMARLSGKSRTAGAEFASQYEPIDAAAKGLATQVQALQTRLGDQVGTDRSLLEVEVEFRAIEKIIDQGARWLQDMRTQLKAREAAGGDEDAQIKIREDAARCELLVARLKTLRALSTAAQQSCQQIQATATRRANFMQMLQRALTSNVKDWRKLVSPLADSARQGAASAPTLGGPMDCHRDLQLCVKEAIAACDQLQGHEKALAEGLEALAAQLKAAA